MKKSIIYIGLALLSASCAAPKNEHITINKEVMNDKVAGAWAAKMIGVMYGREMEFKALAKTYEDSIPWYPELIEKALLEDDIYGQLSFMNSLEKHGKNATTNLLAQDFANASFPLCHANLQARKNIFDGLTPPFTGEPSNNIHADDIDFQIESDFIGFIHPAMTQSSNAMADSIGRIMAYGDGLYGGMFVAAMHSIAFYENDIQTVINKALEAIPSESTYALCIKDVIDSHKKYPDDWRKTWSVIEDKWAKHDVCAPYHDFNIDAKLNGAYIVIGLLYGNSDLQKTMEIAIRCGQDTDCNSANAAAVLGVMQGYEKLPEEFKSHIPNIADKHFLHTQSSFNTAKQQTLKFIEENIIRHGGKITEDSYVIKLQQAKFNGQLEQSFPNSKLSYEMRMKDAKHWTLTGDWKDFVYGDGDPDLYKVAHSPKDELNIEFEGTGVSLLGSWNVDGGKADIYIDGKHVKQVDTYYREEAGKYDVNRAYLFHDLNLAPGKHTLKLVVSESKNPKSSGNKIYLERALVYHSH
ncbi:MAG: ADP-ribosylglycohydrolase family protein [Sphingobacterium composti]|uniref:ADP-ribosylglycohydrolase family protein n=1 Tax=Sphingobacterium composti TaxID=363260 RepID=UPI00135B7BC5|nr:ADP-ribosylglycohydrolase family protein [Sphingobacterium composti Ten et al. 2007 non Yoo et al. 2007]